MTDRTATKSLWEEVLPRAEKVLQLVSESPPKQTFNIPIAHMQVVAAMFCRAHRLYDGVLVLLKNQLPEEAMFLARSLFEDSLHLRQLADDVQNRNALILGWVNASINEKRGLFEVAKACGLDTDIGPAITSLDEESQKLQERAREHNVSSFKSFLSVKDAAFQFGRKDEYWIYEWAHESVHGTDAAWMFARQRLAADTVGLNAKTGDPTVLSSFAHFAAKSMADGASAAFNIFGWILPPELEQMVSEMERLIEADRESPPSDADGSKKE